MNDTDTVDTVDMLDEREVGTLNDVLFSCLTAEERHFFGILDETRVIEAETLPRAAVPLLRTDQREA